MKSTDHFKRTIEQHLNHVAIQDPLFAQTLKKENKNIDDCITYIFNQVKNSGCNGFQEDNIQIKVIDSIQGFFEEGDIHNHCVFTNEYYKEENSLILSSLVNDVPTETIEVDLDTLKIKQSRGRGNKPTPHHKKIVEIVEKNIFQIQEIAQKQIA